MIGSLHLKLQVGILQIHGKYNLVCSTPPPPPSLIGKVRFYATIKKWDYNFISLELKLHISFSANVFQTLLHVTSAVFSPNI